VTDAAAVVAGTGVALTGAEIGGGPGVGLVVAGVGVPAAWFAFGSARLRRRLEVERSARRRAGAMAAAQDARIHALRHRLRDLDTAQSTSRDELRTATTGLLATKVELAHMRSELDAARHELGSAREQLVEVREQLAVLLSTPGPAVVEPIEPQRRLILPPDVVRARAAQFHSADQAVFAAFVESDLDDLTGILSVSDVLQHAREQDAVRQAELLTGASDPTVPAAAPAEESEAGRGPTGTGEPERGVSFGSTRDDDGLASSAA
jgi:septal ring factor EnvC (AmiA/AmiB activator)